MVICQCNRALRDDNLKAHIKGYHTISTMSRLQWKTVILWIDLMIIFVICIGLNQSWVPNQVTYLIRLTSKSEYIHGNNNAYYTD